MEKVIIEAYQFKELNEKAKDRVINWLDEDPVEVQYENQFFYYRYFSEGSEDDISEHCELNNYLFNIYGQPIHHLIRSSENE